MKLYKKILIITFLLVIFTYVCNITLLPTDLILIQGETLDLKTILGITVGKTKNDLKILEASSNINKNTIDDVGTLDVNLNLFGRIPIKDVKVNVIPKTTVIPVGKAIGMKLYTDGVLIVGMTEIEGKRPYENTGLQEGDRIIEINQNKISSTDDLVLAVNNSKRKSSRNKIQKR